MTRVILVSTEPNSARGGIATSVSAFSKGLRQQGLEVLNITSHSPSSGKLVNSLLFLFSLLKIAKERFYEFNNKKDTGLIYLHVGPRGSMLRKLIIALLSKSLGYKIYTHYHSATFEDYLTTRGFWNLAVRSLCTISSRNLVLSNWWYELFDSHKIRRVCIVPNLIDLNTPPRTYPRQKKIISISRLVQEKNIQKVIEAMCLLPTDYHLCIGGDGPYREFLERQVIDLGLSNRVSFLGWISPPERDNLYATCKVLVAPSHHDSFGLVFIESLAFGCPVVTGPNPAVKAALNGLPGVYHSKSYQATDVAVSILVAINNQLPDNTISESCIKKYGIQEISAELSKLLTAEP